MTPSRITRAGLLAALLWPGLAAAAGLNDTGITQCANATQNNLTCPQAGFPSQDAETGRDAQQTAGTLTKVGGGSAGFDFTKLDSGGHPLPASATTWDCVRDNVTGLIWEVKTDNSGIISPYPPPGLRDKDSTYTWYNSDSATNGGNAGSLGSDTCSGTLPNNQCNTQAYVAAVNALSPALCGYTDWRLPTVEELNNIVDHSRPGPAIDMTYFPGTVSGYFWSASPSVSDAGRAWSVGFWSGYVGTGSKGDSDAVRLVRGGPPYTPETTPTSDFILDDVNGTAYHKTTGLTWKRCAEGQSWDSVNKTCTGTAAGGYTWSAALSLASGGWRLPNINELHSIVERRNSNPAINATVFPNISSDDFLLFWSTSLLPSSGSLVWIISFISGSNGDVHAGHSSSFAVRLVRGGQYSLLSVSKDGGGSGTVASNLPGIECGEFCQGSFANELLAAGQIILTATPDAGSTFGGWTDCPSASGNQCTIALSTATDTHVTATFNLTTPTPCTLDVDGNNTAAALEDGLLTIRYEFGFRGATLITGAVAAGCTRCTAAAIETYLAQCEVAKTTDIDGNNAVAALEDGLLTIRYEFGFRGATLTTGAVGASCTRCTAAAIESYLGSLTP